MKLIQNQSGTVKDDVPTQTQIHMFARSQVSMPFVYAPHFGYSKKSYAPSIFTFYQKDKPTGPIVTTQCDVHEADNEIEMCQERSISVGQIAAEALALPNGDGRLTIFAVTPAGKPFYQIIAV